MTVAYCRISGAHLACGMGYPDYVVAAFRGYLPTVYDRRYRFPNRPLRLPKKLSSSSTLGSAPRSSS